MKYLLSLIGIVFITGFVYSQTIFIPAIPHGVNPTIMYIGIGSNNPNSISKEQAYITDAFGINISIYKPILKKKKFTFGLNAGADYSFSNKDQLSTLPDPYHVTKESSSNVTFKSSGSKSQTAFKFEIGPQANFHFGKRFILSPIFQVGYLSLTQKEFSAVQTTQLNGSTYTYNLLSQTETKTRGLAIVPKLRVQYFVTRRIGFWADGNYTFGPGIKNSVSTFTPKGEPDTNGNYPFPQMQAGTNKTEVRETKYKTIGINAGLVIKIGKIKHSLGVSYPNW